MERNSDVHAGTGTLGESGATETVKPTHTSAVSTHCGLPAGDLLHVWVTGWVGGLEAVAVIMVSYSMC